MERIQVDSHVCSGLPFEEEMISQAEEVLGAIPGWYWENREAIQKNRIEQDEWADKIAVEIDEIMRRLNTVRQ